MIRILSGYGIGGVLAVIFAKAYFNSSKSILASL